MPRVLVVEDDTAVRGVIWHLLTQAGFEVVEAEDGEQGLARYGEQRIDVVLTDLFMPVMDGMELIRQLLDQDPAAKIVAMTGVDGYSIFPERLPEASRLGAFRVLEKPFSEDALLLVLEEALRGDHPGSGARQGPT